MKRSGDRCNGALTTSSALSDVVALRVDSEGRCRISRTPQYAKTHRRSFEFPQRKIRDAAVPGYAVGETPTSARRVTLAFVETERGRSHALALISASDGAKVNASPLNTGLRPTKSFERVGGGGGGGSGGSSGESQSAPLPAWIDAEAKRAPPLRLCRTWYGGYDALLEHDTTPAAAALYRPQRSSCAASTAATCGARRRAEARRRPLRASSSLSLLPRLSAAVIPLRRRDEPSLSRSAAPLLATDPPVSASPSPSPLRRRPFAASAAPLLPVDIADDRPPPQSLRKCETVLALSGVDARRAVNRLRPERVCSRCSSLLSLANAGSRYSLSAVAGFVPVDDRFSCKLCLDDVSASEATIIAHCRCTFCTKCMKSYAEYEIMNGAYDISCPDSRCILQGVMTTAEVELLVSPELIEKHRKFRLNHEVAMDGGRAFCPRAGCETICVVSGGVAGSSTGIAPTGGVGPPQPVFCPTCSHHFCSACTNKWHAGIDCTAYIRQMALEVGSVPGSDGLIGLSGESDLIKWCPMCRVPIEKDEGCAQMMCKRCKHVFCWYCLASLDDDFLLRHYDKGPCKNKLGHSRASVIWHRAQVVGIFAGFGLLLLVASPLLLLAAPCIVCCKCRLCNTNSGKTIDGDEPEGMDQEVELANDELQRVTDTVKE